MPSNARDWMSSLSCRSVSSDRNGVRAGSIESRYGAESRCRAQGVARSVVAGRRLWASVDFYMNWWTSSTGERELESDRQITRSSSNPIWSLWPGPYVNLHDEC